MKRNLFGDPRPANYDEIIEALDQRDADPIECNAELTFNEDEGDYHGWSAEVRDNATGNEVFTTLGYESKEALIRDLEAARITDYIEL